jgi:hypothetical protein
MSMTVDDLISLRSQVISGFVEGGITEEAYRADLDALAVELDRLPACYLLPARPWVWPRISAGRSAVDEPRRRLVALGRSVQPTGSVERGEQRANDRIYDAYPCRPGASPQLQLW